MSPMIVTDLSEAFVLCTRSNEKSFVRSFVRSFSCVFVLVNHSMMIPSSLHSFLNSFASVFLSFFLSLFAVDYFGEQLAAQGYSYYGSEALYSGVSGTLMHADIYMGVVYYQRLRHMVSDKSQVRAVGPVNTLTRQLSLIHI